MRRSSLTALMVLAAVGCGGDGDGDGGGGEQRASEQPVRCTPAPGSERAVRVRPGWKAGDERTLTIEKAREEGGAPPRRSTSTARLRVLESGGGRSALRLTLDDVGFAVGPNVPPELIERLKGQATGLTLEYTTDAGGRFDRIRNVAQVREQLIRMIDVVVETTGSDPRAQAAARQTRQLLESETFVQNGVGEEARLLHSAYGLDLEPGPPVADDYELSNPFGGEPIPAEARTRLVAPRDRNGCAAIARTVEADGEDVLAAVRRFFRQPGRPALDPSQFRDADLIQETRFAYDPGSGWVVRAEGVKRLTISGRGRVDRVVVTTR